MDRNEAISLGYHYYCMGCSKVYREIPTEHYEDGHGGRRMEMCNCGCDLFRRFQDDIED